MKVEELEKKIIDLYKKRSICEHEVKNHVTSILRRIDLEKITSVEKYVGPIESRLTHDTVYYDWLINDKHLYYSLPINLCLQCSFNASPWLQSM